MANYCSNDITVYGKNKELIEKCLNLFKGKRYGGALIQEERNEDFENEQIRKGKVLFDVRTYVVDLSESIGTRDNLFYFKIWIESPWSPIIEDLNNSIHDFVSKEVSAVGIAEECGFDIYINTDKDCIFYEDRFGYDDFEGRFDSTTFATEEEIVKYVNECWHTNFNSYEEILAYIDDNEVDWKVYEYDFE